MPAPSALAPASPRFLAHIRLAKTIARRLGFSEDLQQAALLGLHLADVAAPPDMPAGEFRSYAAIRIRGEALDHLRRVAHGGRRQGKTARKPHLPDPESVAMGQALGLLPETGRHHHALAPELSPEEQAIANQEAAARAAILAGIDALPDRQRLIVRRRLRGDENMAVAKDLGISQARVSQILAQAIAKLRS